MTPTQECRPARASRVTATARARRVRSAARVTASPACGAVPGRRRRDPVDTTKRPLMRRRRPGVPRDRTGSGHCEPGRGVGCMSHPTQRSGVPPGERLVLRDSGHHLVTGQGIVSPSGRCGEVIARGFYGPPTGRRRLGAALPQCLHCGYLRLPRWAGPRGGQHVGSCGGAYRVVLAGDKRPGGQRERHHQPRWVGGQVRRRWVAGAAPALDPRRALHRRPGLRPEHRQARS